MQTLMSTKSSQGRQLMIIRNDCIDFVGWQQHIVYVLDC